MALATVVPAPLAGIPSRVPEGPGPLMAPQPDPAARREHGATPGTDGRRCHGTCAHEARPARPPHRGRLLLRGRDGQYPDRPCEPAALPCSRRGEDKPQSAGQGLALSAGLRRCGRHASPHRLPSHLHLARSRPAGRAVAGNASRTVNFLSTRPGTGNVVLLESPGDDWSRRRPRESSISPLTQFSRRRGTRRSPGT